MHVIEEKEYVFYKHKKRNRELTPVELSTIPFKVVVNNYRQQEDLLEKSGEDTSTIIITRQYGLPPQPVRYLKYPDYDWF
jgi:hypothetical protein